ncbi:similar to An12g05550 [Aspergillus luchuensis IFO 4308]|nr:similar to An12g05550 [Aspergillus luchuensis IFO 4308]
MDHPKANAEKVFISSALDPLAVGEINEGLQPHEEVSKMLSILTDAGIQCCFVQEQALIYYGTTRVPRDLVLCIPDEQFQRAVELFSSNSHILQPCGPSPLRSPNLLNHKYPRFKAIGWASFWLLVPGNYCHLTVKPENIEWSLGGLPYPKLSVYVQSAIDSKSLLDLEELIDGMDLSEEWGHKTLDLEGQTDTQWLEDRAQAFRDDGVDEMFIFVDPTPVSRREIWLDAVSEIWIQGPKECPQAWFVDILNTQLAKFDAYREPNSVAI